jgi:hypothetical protein
MVSLETECVRLGTVEVPRSIPAPAPIPNCGSIKELRKLEWPLSVKVSVNWGAAEQSAHNSPVLR